MQRYWIFKDDDLMADLPAMSEEDAIKRFLSRSNVEYNYRYYAVLAPCYF